MTHASNLQHGFAVTGLPPARHSSTGAREEYEAWHGRVECEPAFNAIQAQVVLDRV